MSTIEAAQPFAPAVDQSWIPAPLYRLSLEQYEALVDSGVFTAKDRFHLINGYLVAKMRQNDPHSTADELCGVELARAIPDGWHVRAGKPIRLSGQVSKPEPDRCVVRGSVRDYSRKTPKASDVALVVEVADSSLKLDRRMAEIYSAAGIPTYWIINLTDSQLEVYTDPGPNGYTARRDCTAGQSVPLVIDGTEVGEIPIADLLPESA